MRKLLVALVLQLAAVPAVAAAEQYICIGEHAGGVRYFEDRGEWGSTTFKADDMKFVVTGSEYAGYPLVVKRTGEEAPRFGCKTAFDEDGYLSCSGASGSFKMNNKSMRFMQVYEAGYVNSGQAADAPANTPLVLIGKCTSF